MGMVSFGADEGSQLVQLTGQNANVPSNSTVHTNVRECVLRNYTSDNGLCRTLYEGTIELYSRSLPNHQRLNYCMPFVNQSQLM